MLQKILPQTFIFAKVCGLKVVNIKVSTKFITLPDKNIRRQEVLGVFSKKDVPKFVENHRVKVKSGQNP